ncbi:50S ribosomal protein L18 [Candidatus Beckwithbacteria bacterium CG23_combo_of_CG06-09_8_20_14_all_34_8]|uniref:Large ribosomal subunit protein uL18 n=1 Tax=Candidatus Beckwithbacteria bacterium CG23_combo_of_CG06-09_8_20_14_all_34_8 TaxID=1974497 RepID=A0A2H0B6V2_9BACT|nr:MAG: 50S ribosomal protein L18 [Candidatus Beckwithbacteria bacterium CG23_combo_of_CG06-09_8_20_14_all_34_8]
MNRTRQTQSQIRSQRNRSKVKRFSNRVRLLVSRSNKHIIAQLIDQENKTLITIDDKAIKSDKKMTKTEKSLELGKVVAQKAKEQKIKELVFDRGAYKYHGRVKAVCEGAREGGVTI